MSDPTTTTRIELVNGAFATIEQHLEVGSTNSALRDRFVDEHEPFAPYHAIVTGSQTAGRGRLDRDWTAPAGQSIALSVYLEFDAEPARRAIGWVSLAAGLAVAAAIDGLADDAASRVSVKWPNDVLVDGRKVCGVLGEMLGVVDGGRAFACVIGMGVNTVMPAEALPAPHATSLQVAGLIGAVEPPADRGLSARAQAFAAEIVRQLAARIDRLAQAGGDAEASGLRTEFERRCSTLGAEVRVTLPGDEAIEGEAVAIGSAGELRVRLADGQERELQVGDVEHVRPLRGEWVAGGGA